MWWSIGGGIIIFALGMFIFLKPGLIWKLTEEWKSYRADEHLSFLLNKKKEGDHEAKNSRNNGEK